MHNFTCSAPIWGNCSKTPEIIINWNLRRKKITKNLAIQRDLKTRHGNYRGEIYLPYDRLKNTCQNNNLLKLVIKCTGEALIIIFADFASTRTWPISIKKPHKTRHCKKQPISYAVILLPIIFVEQLTFCVISTTEETCVHGTNHKNFYNRRKTTHYVKIPWMKIKIEDPKFIKFLVFQYANKYPIQTTTVPWESFYIKAYFSRQK